VITESANAGDSGMTSRSMSPASSAGGVKLALVVRESVSQLLRVQDLIPARQLAQSDAREVPIALLDLLEPAIPAAHILFDELRQRRILGQVVAEVAPPEFASEVVLKDRPSEDHGRDTDRPTEVREAPPLFSASFGSVDVNDVAVLPITGPFADLLPAPLPVRVDQRRDELDQTAQLGELDR